MFQNYNQLKELWGVNLTTKHMVGATHKVCRVMTNQNLGVEHNDEVEESPME